MINKPPDVLEKDTAKWKQLEQDLLNSAAALMKYSGAEEITIQGKRGSKTNRITIVVTAKRDRSITVWHKK